jgi:hypothetical protein
MHKVLYSPGAGGACLAHDANTPFIIKGGLGLCSPWVCLSRRLAACS